MSEEKMIFSIDIGNKNSLVAYCSDNKVEVCTNPGFSRVSPSILVVNEEGKRLFGTVADLARSSNASSIINNIKCLVNCKDKIKIRNKVFRKEEVIAFAMTQLHSYIPKPKYNILQLIVPIWWSNKQRQTMIDSAKIAGFEKVNIINSTSSAAGDIYPRLLHEENNAVIVDCGEECYVISLYKIERSKISLKGFKKVDVGGEKITELTINLIKEKLKKNACPEFDINEIPNIENNPSFAYSFRKAAIKVKEAMAASNVGLFEFMGSIPTQDCKVVVNKEEFDTQIHDEIKKIKECVRQFKDTILKDNKITFFEILGGCGRVRAIREATEDVLGMESTQRLNADEAFVEGASYLGLLQTQVDDKIDFSDSPDPLSEREIQEIKAKMAEDLENENANENVEELYQKLQKIAYNILNYIKRNSYHVGDFNDRNGSFEKLSEQFMKFYEEAEESQDAKIYLDFGNAWEKIVNGAVNIIDAIHTLDEHKKNGIVDMREISCNMISNNLDDLRGALSSLRGVDGKPFVKENIEALKQFENIIESFLKENNFQNVSFNPSLYDELKRDTILYKK